MRGTVIGIPTAKPLIELLPAVYQEDEMTGRLTAGLDDVLAPVFMTLDALDAHVDPQLCPEDFIDWLAGWVGLVLDETWPVDRRRELVARGVEIYRMRGTVEGLRAEVEIFTGGTVEISETGGTAWSPTPGGEFPGEAEPRLAVRVTVDHPEALSEKTLDALVAAAKPAHVVHRVEILATGSKPDTAAPRGREKQ
jgi:phage tail-like protein